MTFGRPGETIANRYRLEELLGRGGYGEVWRALDTHRNHRVAIKLVLNRNRNAAWHEASILTALKDQHILEVNNADVAVDLPYLDTALAQCSLDAKAMPLGAEPGQAVDWMRRALRGLDLCHRRGLLHRDVKPHNIFLAASGDAKLGDFGIAALMDAAGTADIEGDHQIWAPELFEGERTSVSSDIYSAAVTLYSLLAGRYPFQGITDMDDRRMAALEGKFPALRDVAPHVSQDLSDRVKRGMSVSPADRYPTAASFDSALALRPRSAAFTPISPHDGHNRCWQVDTKTGQLRVCTHPASAPARTIVEVRREASGNRVREHCSEASERELPTRLRRVFNALR